jgi:hypothetical protein
VRKSEGEGKLAKPRHKWGTLLKWIFNKYVWDNKPDSSDSGRNKWQVFVDAVMNLWLPQNAAIFLTG